MICPSCRTALLPKDASNTLYVRAHGLRPVGAIEVAVCHCCIDRAKTHPLEIRDALAKLYNRRTAN